MEISYSSNAKENDPTYEDEEIDHDDDQREDKYKTTIPEIVKVVPKRNKPSLKSEGDQGIEQKDA